MSPVYSSHLESASTLYLFVGTVVVTVTATGPCPTSHHGTMGVAIGCLCAVCLWSCAACLSRSAPNWGAILMPPWTRFPDHPFSTVCPGFFQPTGGRANVFRKKCNNHRVSVTHLRSLSQATPALGDSWR